MVTAVDSSSDDTPRGREAAAPAEPARPEPSRLAALFADTGLIAGRYLRQTLRSRLATLIGLVQPLLFLVLFGPLLDRVPLGGAGDSWQTLTPGLLVQLGLFSSGFAGFTLLMEKHQGVVERMRVTPVSRLGLLLGRVLSNVLHLLFQAALLVLVAVGFGLRAPVWGVLLGFGFVALLSASLSSLSYALAMRASGPQEFAPIVNSVNLPAMLLSGILLPMSLAPSWLDSLSRLVPFRYLVDAVRAAFTGSYASGEVLLGAGVAVALTVVSVWLGSRVFRTSAS